MQSLPRKSPRKSPIEIRKKLSPLARLRSKSVIFITTLRSSQEEREIIAQERDIITSVSESSDRSKIITAYQHISKNLVLDGDRLVHLANIKNDLATVTNVSLAVGVLNRNKKIQQQIKKLKDIIQQIMVIPDSTLKLRKTKELLSNNPSLDLDKLLSMAKCITIDECTINTIKLVVNEVKGRPPRRNSD